MSISSRLWLRCYDTALASATSPFVVSLSRGSLVKSSFKAYIAQDAFYLISFKKAFASAATICRKDLDVFGVDHFETLEVLIEDELKMHAKFAHDLDIDISSVSPLPATLLYTEFLGEASKTNYISHICAAMTPCMTLYGWLGRRADSSGLAHTSHPYLRWIQEYSSKEFETHAQRLEMLLDHYADKDGQSYDDLVKLYAKAMELEYNFFSAHETENWTGITPKLLCIDFDDTISVGDTISSLCKAGLKAQQKSEAIHEELFQSYLAEYQKFMSLNLPEKVVESGNFKRDDIDKFLGKYSTFEDSMLTPVEQAGLLKGISPECLTKVAAEMPMKAGAIDTIEYAINSCPSMETHILSVNWSRRFLQSMMTYNSPTSRVQIHANELIGLHEETSEDNLESISTGCIQRVMTGPQQKGEMLQSIIAKNENSHPNIYIGDSLGDLSALLESDIGIIIGKSSSIRKVCSTYGVELQTVDQLVLNTDAGSAQTVAVNRKKPVLYTAESWPHIGFCLFGKRYVSNWLNKEVKTFSRGYHVSARSGREAPKVLSVAGSDSGGGAGIQADIKTCCAFNVFSTTAVTCLTAQNTVGVTLVGATSTAMIRAQLEAVLSDIGTDALKTGMIPSVELASEIARAITKYAVKNVVVDPVMVSTSGSLLMDPDQARDIIRILFPVATVVTPNIPEAMAILQLMSSSPVATAIESVEDMEAAAKGIYALGPAYVLLKGGHLAPSNTTGDIIDVLYDGQRFTRITGQLIKTSNVHGTGCTLSTAIACELANGLNIIQAISSARSYLTATLQLSVDSSIGTGSHGPMLHMAPHYTNSLAPNKESCSSPQRQLIPVDLSLYAVTDSTLNEKLGHSMEDVVTAAVAGGATIVQLREKNITTSAFVDLARRVLQITRRAGVPLIINDRVDVAMAIGADGVHVGQSDMSAAEVRRLLGPNMILGVSTKSCEEAIKAQEDGADYVGTGAVYPTNTKVVTRELGVAGLREVCNTPGLIIPVVAIGGIAGEERIAACLQPGGAQGIAVVSAIFGERDVLQATLSLSTLVRAAMRTSTQK